MSEKSELPKGYFMPQLEIVENISELKSRFAKNKIIESLTSIYEADFTVVLAEPGNGKSRLLKELVNKSTESAFDGFFLDLKKVGNYQISDRIEFFLVTQKKMPESEFEISAERDYFYTKGFKLNSERAILCLDALDEVSNEVVFDLIEQITDLKGKHPTLRIVLSCRDYIYKRYSSILSKFNPNILYVRPFNPYMIKVYLVSKEFTENDAESVINHFYRNFNLEVITSPRILEIFAGLAKEMTIKKVLELRKAQLIEEFIYGKLKMEAAKQNKNETVLIKRVLEKIALVMEIYQSNMIKKDDLLTFFDNVNSNLSDVFFHQIVLDEFLTRSFLILSPDGESVQFENAEFQEYLAAKEISRMGRTDQVLFDLTVEERLRELLPSWSNTIKYLFELKPDLQFPLIDFVCKRNSIHNSDFLERTLIVEEAYLATIPKKERSEIFEKLFDLFQRNNWIIRYTMAPRMARYFNEGNKNTLDKYLKSRNWFHKANAITILNHIFHLEKITPNEFYKDKLVSTIKSKSTIKWVKGMSALTLAYYKDLEVLKSVFTYFKDIGSSERRDFLRACYNADPNNPFTIDLYVEEIKLESSSLIPTPLIRELNSAAGISYFLKKITTDKEFTDWYRNHSPDSYSLNPFIENIKKTYNPEIQGLMRDIVLNNAKHYVSSSFHKKLLEVLREKDPHFLSAVIDFTKEGSGYLRNWFIYNKLFVELLNEENTREFITKMNIDKTYTPALMNVFYEYFGKSELRAIAILKIVEQELPTEYKELNDQISANEGAKLKTDRKIYEEYLHLIEPAPGKYNEGVFKYYNENREVLRKYITSEDDAKMKKLLEETVLIFDFKNARLKITDESSDNSRSFKYSSNIPIFESAIPLFEEFIIDQTKYRQKLIEFLPYSFFTDKSGTLYKEIGTLSTKELEDFISFYNTPRKDDLILVNVGTFFEACKHFKIAQAIPFLKKIVEDSRYRNYERTEALKIISQLGSEIAFLSLIFEKYKVSAIKTDRELALLSNEILIFSEGDVKIKPIQWRFNEILKNPIEAPDSDSTGSILTIDMEYKSGYLLKPLKAVSDPELINLYLDFFRRTIALYKKNTKYRVYAAYAWDIVFGYIGNLKVFRMYQPIEKLESEIRLIPKFKGYNQLLNQMKNIRLEYLNILGKPSEFSECVKKYNVIRDRAYNDVRSAKDFYFILSDIIESDIRRWVEEEGGYSLLEKLNGGEVLIQKTIKTQLENGLMSRGFRRNEVRIRREEQLLDDKRTDFVISYGFIGQVLIELKLTANPEVTKADYKKKLLQYVKGTNSDYGIFLIFQVDETKPWEKIRSSVEKIYSDLSEKIKIIGLNCTKSN